MMGAGEYTELCSDVLAGTVLASNASKELLADLEEPVDVISLLQCQNIFTAEFTLKYHCT
jgi:hypothetical protein